MDMFMIDISDLKNVEIDDEVTLFGEDLPVTELADILGTIPYELTCSVSKRVRRIYI
jgi:alanine racemase